MAREGGSTASRSGSLGFLAVFRRGFQEGRQHWRSKAGLTTTRVAERTATRAAKRTNAGAGLIGGECTSWNATIETIRLKIRHNVCTPTFAYVYIRGVSPRSFRCRQTYALRRTNSSPSGHEEGPT